MDFCVSQFWCNEKKLKLLPTRVVSGKWL